MRFSGRSSKSFMTMSNENAYKFDMTGQCLMKSCGWCFPQAAWEFVKESFRIRWSVYNSSFPNRIERNFDATFPSRLDSFSKQWKFHPWAVWKSFNRSSSEHWIVKEHKRVSEVAASSREMRKVHDKDPIIIHYDKQISVNAFTQQ